MIHHVFVYNEVVQVHEGLEASEAFEVIGSLVRQH